MPDRKIPTQPFGDAEAKIDRDSTLVALCLILLVGTAAGLIAYFGLH